MGGDPFELLGLGSEILLVLPELWGQVSFSYKYEGNARGRLEGPDPESLRLPLESLSFDPCAGATLSFLYMRLHCSVESMDGSISIRRPTSSGRLAVEGFSPAVKVE